MKIALTADLHLGFRQFNNQQRWNDFLQTFVKLNHKVRESNVDVFVIAGDIFDKYRPHPGLVRRFLKEMTSLDVPVVLIRGNHDSPKILFEKYGGDTLHLIRDVSKCIYLNKSNPTYEVENTCFIGLGYVGFNVGQKIKDQISGVNTNAETKIGVFHQLLDYPGIPENHSDMSRGFLKNLGLDYILMGHYHLAYSEPKLFNSGSPEYWAFDQAEQIHVNLDNDEEKITPHKKKGFYIIETNNGKNEFIETKPARSMFCITYNSEKFESKQITKIKDHLEKYNIDDIMVKTIICGKNKFGRINLSKKLTLEKPLIHNTTIKLTPSSILPDKTETTKAQAEYLIERGIDQKTAYKVAEWLDKNKSRFALMKNTEALKVLEEVLKKK